MKKLSLLLVGLLCLSVGVHAGEVITNDTGADAVGLRVTFSEPVTITAFGDTLTAVTPQTLSSEVVFSGGTVSAWASHWFNYAPATASVMEIEWLTGLVESQVSSRYQEIMEEIAQYPGENEPLYMPADDEAIWLTDLEGHADIYDNDSIKINYAPDFDQSQITKIEVYRNGVKMWFLPDLLDVVTNEQMKTFNGIPIENSIASDHTDHAIWGYEYRVVVHNQDPELTGGTSVFIESPVDCRFSKRFADLTWMWDVQLNKYQLLDSELREFFTRLRDDGFNGVSLTVNYFMETPHSTEIREWFEVNSGTWSNLLTASREDLGQVLDAISHVGLMAEVRVIINISQDWVRSSPAGTCSLWSCIEPSDLDQWFDNYARLIVDLAQFCEAHGADILTPFTEMNSLQKHPQKLHAFYSEVDAYFSGIFTFEESAHHFLMSEIEGEAGFDELAGVFWDWRDDSGRFLGVEWSCWGIPMESQYDQRFSKMVPRFRSHWEPALSYYQTRYPQNEITYGEFGFYPVDGWAMGDYSLKTGSDRDDQEAADILAASLVAACHMGVDGLTLWSLTIGNVTGVRSHGSASEGRTLVNYFSMDDPRYRIASAVFGGVPDRVPFELGKLESISRIRPPIANDHYESYRGYEPDEPGDSPEEHDPNHEVLQYSSKDINPSLEWHLENEALGKPTRTVTIVVRAKGKPDAQLPVLVVTANGQAIKEIEALTFDAWRDYAFDIELPASLTVFSVGMASPQRGDHVSIDRVTVNGERHEMESLPEYGLIGAAPELDPTYISWWNPGRIAWVIDLSE